MWADFKMIKFLKLGSPVQKLFNVEKLHFFHCSYGVMAHFNIGQLFNRLNQISKTNYFGMCPCAAGNL